ncbi:MAG: hypothetical protein CME61_01600 [Halobacteriovoraceae bacterium]|nr:hypothetical protein [Halobacteriovoraceae bacterium]
MIKIYYISFLVFFISCGSTSKNGLTYLNEVANVHVPPVGEDIGNKDLHINDVENDGEEKRRIIVVLSPLTSLCLPEIKELQLKNLSWGTNFLNYINQVQINSSQGSFDWFRFEILNKIFVEESFLKKLTKKNLNTSNFWQAYVETPYSDIERYKKIELRIKDLFPKSDRTNKKKPELNYLVKIITDLEEFKGEDNSIFIRPIRRVRSILKLKRSCSRFKEGVMNAWLNNLKDEIN